MSYAERLSKLIDLSRVLYKEQPDEVIADFLVSHAEYGTMDSLWDKDEPIAIVRWNISQDGLVCHVLDLVIKKGYRGGKIMKYFIAKNWSKFPTVRFIKYQRGARGDNRFRIMNITDFFKGDVSACLVQQNMW